MVKENPIHKQQIDPILMSDRFPFYDLDGRLAANGAEIAAIVAGREEEMARAYWDSFNALTLVERKVEGDLLASYIAGSAKHMREKYAHADGQAAATIACQNTHMALRVGLPLASVLSCIGESQRTTYRYVIEACAGDAERTTRLCAAINRLALLEFDIMETYAEKLNRAVISGERQALAGDFDQSIASLVQDTDSVRRELAKQAASADQAAKGMIAKTSEVAAASEQSAIAMREAASTAAGLIRAIEDARSEVEASSHVAIRASEQAGEAVAMSEALSHHAESIESILGLIREIAGQTNLLALNATIEAARAERIGARLCRRRAGGEEPRQRDRARDRRYRGQDHRDPAGDARVGRRQPVDPADDRRGAAIGAAHPRRDGRAGADGHLDHRGGRRDRARRRLDVLDDRQHPQRFGHGRGRDQRAERGILAHGRAAPVARKGGERVQPAWVA